MVWDQLVLKTPSSHIHQTVERFPLLSSKGGWAMMGDGAFYLWCCGHFPSVHQLSPLCKLDAN